MKMVMMGNLVPGRTWRGSGGCALTRAGTWRYWGILILILRCGGSRKSEIGLKITMGTCYLICEVINAAMLSPVCCTRHGGFTPRCRRGLVG